MSDKNLVFAVNRLLSAARHLGECRRDKALLNGIELSDLQLLELDAQQLCDVIDLLDSFFASLSDADHSRQLTYKSTIKTLARKLTEHSQKPKVQEPSAGSEDEEETPAHKLTLDRTCGLQNVPNLLADWNGGPVKPQPVIKDNTEVFGERVPNVFLDLATAELDEEVAGLWRISSGNQTVARFYSQQEALDWWALFQHFQATNSTETQTPQALIEAVSAGAVPAEVSSGLRGVRHAWLYHERESWYLVTRAHQILARFPSKKLAETWWAAFRYPDRIALNSGKPPTKQQNNNSPRKSPQKSTNKSRKSSGSNGSTSHHSPVPSGYNDPLMPYSEKYGMAEWDFS
ncbi:MAG: hypothetical protein IT422_22535 [Pirellulaceae bacterium]|nr:hypothetical protein [Pirellulaceae bacterium]